MTGQAPNPQTVESICAAIAALSGRSPEDVAKEYEARRTAPPHTTRAPRHEDLLARLKTRIGMSPAISTRQSSALRSTLTDTPTATPLPPTSLAVLDAMLRETVDHVPDARGPTLTLPAMPEHQTQTWHTLLDVEALGRPWTIIGGQMTMLHCLQHSAPFPRVTDDADIAIDVTVTRDALRETTRLLRDHGYDESPTSDRYGYRYTRQRSTIDVLIPEGLDRQDRPAQTTTGRPGLPVPGTRQALARTERVHLAIDGRTGYVRRPNLLGALTIKANAHLVDSRDPDRHVDDIATLSRIGLDDPRRVLQDARPSDRKAARRLLQSVPPEHPAFQRLPDPSAAYALLTRLATPHQ